MATRRYDTRTKRSYTGIVILGFLAALVLVGIAIYSAGGDRPRSAANPPAVITSPAPATGMPAPRETTTGQSVPRPTGR
jgi:hypothetical protein